MADAQDGLRLCCSQTPKTGFLLVFLHPHPYGFRCKIFRPNPFCRIDTSSNMTIGLKISLVRHFVEKNNKDFRRNNATLLFFAFLDFSHFFLQYLDNLPVVRHIDFKRIFMSPPWKGGETYCFSTCVCPWVTKSCPLYNLITVRDISTKLPTFVKHIQTTCHTQEP